MNLIALGIVLVISIGSSSVNSEEIPILPQKLEKCHYGDMECIKTMITIAFKTLYKGDPEVGLVAIDPLHVDGVINMTRNREESLANLNLTFTDNDILGFSEHECTEASGFAKDPIGVYHVQLKGPRLTLHGTYDIGGSLLKTALAGHGYCNFTSVDTVVNITFTGKTHERDGKIYLYTDDLKMTFTTPRLHTDLRNLHGGHKILGQVINDLFNTHWELIMTEMAGPIFRSLSSVYQTAINKLLDKVPYENFFLA